MIHSYWAPALFPKMDAIPGKVNKTKFKAKTGTYHAAVTLSFPVGPETGVYEVDVSD